MNGLKEFITESEQILRGMEDELKKVKDEIIGCINSILEEHIPVKDYLIQDRIKKPDSLKEKILRKGAFEKSEKQASTFIKELDDIIGVRIICLLNDNEENLSNILESYFSQQITGKSYLVSKDYSDDKFPYLAYFYEKQPLCQKNGNKIFKLKLRYIISEEIHYNVELQIKSLTHMFWGELEHMLFYKNYKYNHDNGFHTKMMQSVYKILETLDAQLKDLKNHLSQENEVKDIQNMTTKMFYNSIHKSIKGVYDTELDLREVYSLLSQLGFYKCLDHDEAIRTAKNLMERILEIEFSPDDFNFNEFENIGKLDSYFENYIEQDGIDLFNDQTISLLNEMAKLIEDLSKGFDIFWRCLLAPYARIFISSEQKDPFNIYRESLAELTFHFVNGYFKRYIEDFEFDSYPTNKQFLNNVIIKSLKDCFSHYEKMDFFIEDIHQENICSIIKDFIGVHNDNFDKNDLIQSYNAQDLPSIIDNVSRSLEVQIDFYLNKKLNYDLLKELKDNILNLGELEFDFKIHTDNLDLMIRDKLSVQSIQDLQKQLYYIPEGDN
ncbi:hypothetical protein [Priestia megaterium]